MSHKGLDKPEHKGSRKHEPLSLEKTLSIEDPKETSGDHYYAGKRKTRVGREERKRKKREQGKETVGGGEGQDGWQPRVT